MLKFSPETLTRARNRWPDALKRKWNWEKFDPSADLSSLMSGAIDRPGLHRENVFDLHDGVRLIVSVDRYGFGEHLHVSGSVRGAALKKCMNKGVLKIGEVIRHLHRRTLLISGRDVKLGFFCSPPLHPAIVVHFFDPPLPASVVPTDGSFLTGG